MFNLSLLCDPPIPLVHPTQTEKCPTLASTTTTNISSNTHMAAVEKPQKRLAHLGHGYLMRIEIQAVDVDIVPSRKLGLEINPDYRLAGSEYRRGPEAT